MSTTDIIITVFWSTCFLIGLFASMTNTKQYCYKQIKSFFLPFKHLKNQSMLNMRALTKALQFLCLPTLSILLVLYFWFFNWVDFVGFVTSKSGWAGVLRVILMVAEIVLVVRMYDYYDKRLPNERIIAKINDAVFGDKFKVHATSDWIEANTKPNAYNNSDIARFFYRSIPALGSQYRLDAYKPEGLEDTIIIKTRPR